MAGWTYIPSRDDEEFGEEDVWVCGFERDDSSLKPRRSSKDIHNSSSCYSSAWRSSSAPRRIIHKASNQMRGGHELHDVKTGTGGQSSAPVKIPDWSKIYGKGLASRNGSWVDDGGSDQMGHVDNDDYDDDGDGDGHHHGMVPPHEWLSRKHARSQVSSFSMCEGIGRTLKGRDLSKLRNAILTKTGFLE